MEWQDTFREWAKPPTETEQTKAERAARMVREALRDNAVFRDKDVDVVVIGSYRNNTNVRAASDIDLAAVLRSAYWVECPAGGVPTREMLGLVDAAYTLVEFRRDVEAAIREKFGASETEPGKIALSIDESSARLPADVTPYLIHRRYSGARSLDGAWLWDEGIETRPKNHPNRRLIQWPEQHYAAGVAKNDATGRRFKRVVRIVKRLRDDLVERGVPAAREVASKTRSCFIEHAIANAPNEAFGMGQESYYDSVRVVVRWLWAISRDTTLAPMMMETSGMQALFKPDEPWAPSGLEEFSMAAWRHIGFGSIAA